MVNPQVKTRPTSCNLCGSAEHDRLTVQSGYNIVKCRECGFVYVNPRPDADTLKSLYSDYLSNKMEDVDAWRGYMDEVFDWTVGTLNQRIPEKGSLVDIGCGYGYFVEKALKNGWKASGIDISEKAVKEATARNLDARVMTIEELAEAGERFEVVTMFYVLEHLIDPLGTLSLLKNIIRPGGLLVLRLPHTTPIVKFLSSLGIENNLYDPPFHLSDFSPGTIKAMLVKAGYTDIKTVIGGNTRPERPLPFLVSRTSVLVANLLYSLSGSSVLMPGISKTTIAVNPL